MQLMDSPNPDPKVIMEGFYKITHEIFPLTGFGETPLSYFGPQDISALRRMLERGIAFFLINPDVDILGELVIALHMLGGGDEPVVNSALEFIMGEQTGDGSFGSSPRLTAMGRSSPSRHVVFVAVWALIQ